MQADARKLKEDAVEALTVGSNRMWAEVYSGFDSEGIVSLGTDSDQTLPESGR